MENESGIEKRLSS